MRTIVFHPEGFNGVAICAKPRRVTVTMAKKAVDSTIRRILNYTAEIIFSIILLVVICIPLLFTIPGWFQYVIFGVPRPDLSINPAVWFGLDGTLWVTLLLGLVSLSIGYFLIMRMHPGEISVEEEEEIDESELDDEDVAAEEEEIEEEAEEEAEEIVEAIEEEMVADEDIPLEDQEEELPAEDIEEESEED